MYLPRFYSFVVTLAVFFMLLRAKSLFIFTPNNTFVKRYKKSQELLKTNKVPFIEDVFKPVAEFVNSKIRLDDYSRAKLEKNLLRVGEKITPEQHQAKKIIYPGIMLLIGIVFSFASIVIMAVCAMFSVIMYFQPDAELDKKLKELNGNIIKEFPRFARTLRYSPHKNIIHTIEDYLKVCKGPLYYDLKILHAKLEAGMMEKDALQEFSDTIGIIAIQNYIMAVITGIETSRDNVDTLYAIQEEKVRKMNLANIKEEMMKRPERLERNNAIALYSIFGMNAVAVGLSFIVEFASQFY
ncbi:hypothetical protein [Alkaliphilus peptidifermentans]|uniref:Flp pilus assembly protein TadB n=1 Tax=Alkaliphilus peptidifermentans DSM 18978 TaxID=1120976 RepID=A0A1G5DTP3_9FIRM|nr:hypothetical protein [Alkaliphilus peptidifermentans]SCY17957.1 hypothetical protein SAMN03080606_01009 [Alkaliphilus peptidifermentans DSM 18978]